MRTKDEGLADELYFRLQEGEQSFTELAQQFSQGPEAKSGGWCGPVELGKISSKLAQMLYGSKPGQLWRPTRLGEWLVIVRLEILIPALLDESMRQRLLDELFEAWLEEKLVELTNGGWISLD
ncbi:peptidyl-prolyl cis-trans isomerase [Nostoc sp. XA010]|uniref:peptidylprolyl isomerase n=1 Tax=Nostoc sp. XA010 TaxID=2780407 RepID=UPI001E42756F|nr:peptidyl-prolyl cis-trans isomerase [Nostoc sp. XA010]MCC5660908.1 peptidyl-prolyl cis-trans isomerase [Nostoc sp. XA010]